MTDKKMTENDIPKSLEVKVIVVGSAGVGKTAIVIRHKENRFDSSGFHTLGASYHRFVVPLADRRIVMHLWDTAGEEKFKAMMPMYYRGAVAALLVYDVTDENSFKNLNYWVTDLRVNLGEEVVICMVGNKADKSDKRQVKKGDAETYATEVGADFYMETSALTGDGVNEVFGKLAFSIQTRSASLMQDVRIDDSFGEAVSLSDSTTVNSTAAAAAAAKTKASCARCSSAQRR